MYIIFGPTSCGKSTLAEMFIQNGYKNVVLYTTRPMREGEKNGVDYHFCTECEFDNLELDEIRSYQTIYGVWKYGSFYKDYKEESIIVQSPDFILNNPSLIKNATLVYIDVDEEFLIEMAVKRGDNIEEVKRRMSKDAELYKEVLKKHPKTIVVTNKKFEKTPQELFEEVVIKRE